MKKILFGGMAAICTVAGMSSFKHHNTTAYWYPKSLVAHGILSGSEVKNAQISNFAGFQSSDPGNCDKTGNYCDVEFTTAQLNFRSGVPTSLVGGEQVPRDYNADPNN